MTDSNVGYYIKYDCNREGRGKKGPKSSDIMYSLNAVGCTKCKQASFVRREHRKNESCCSVVLFAFFLRFPAPSSLVQIRLRIKTKQDATFAKAEAQQPLVSNKASSNSFFLWTKYVEDIMP